VFEKKNLKCIIIIIIITSLFTTFNRLIKNLNDDIGEKTRVVNDDYNIKNRDRWIIKLPTRYY